MYTEKRPVYLTKETCIFTPETYIYSKTNTSQGLCSLNFSKEEHSYQGKRSLQNRKETYKRDYIQKSPLKRTIFYTRDILF